MKANIQEVNETKKRYAAAIDDASRAGRGSISGISFRPKQNTGDLGRPYLQIKAG
ncbi:MAG: hypothetical protein Q8R63_05410 [Ramlibacter sp.]|nr:hypothetical protein [Ramlibacter sp.]